MPSLKTLQVADWFFPKLFKYFIETFYVSSLHIWDVFTTFRILSSCVHWHFMHHPNGYRQFSRLIFASFSAWKWLNLAAGMYEVEIYASHTSIFLVETVHCVGLLVAFVWFQRSCSTLHYKTIFDFYLGLLNKGGRLSSYRVCLCWESLGKSRYVWPDKLGFIFG